ncbi:hypothetical protein DE4585_01638 [Mycobacteroides salmoniphilum]|uniref:PsrA tetracyclin repressor-like C-terminal domain-containing protein n=1 Tax=Mycobacteroides salmoniphilum TaxID=404941 RepID=A0A4R8S0X9_9MYCO|nr:hypothetical protein DE4585_01638 [Mycobacteroides salmoniphilum]
MLRAGPEQIALFVELGIKPVLEGDQRFEQTREDRAQAGIGQMVSALSPLLPGMPEEVVAYRVELMLGMSIMHVQNGNRLAGKYGLAAGEHEQYLIDDVVRFFSHALAAPTELRPVG